MDATFMRRGTIGLVAAAALLAGAAPPAPAAPGTPHFTLVMYKVKLGVKGGAHQDQTTPVDANTPSGTVVEEHAQASYSFDDAFDTVAFVVRGRVLGQQPGTFATARRSVVNGTWTNRGGTWNAVTKVQEPYTCSGTIGTTSQASAEMRWRRRGGTLRFTAQTIHALLQMRGEASCPGNAFALGQADIPAYATEFSIPVSALGQRTITRRVSGPLARHRPPADDCRYVVGARCTFGMAWQGVVTFTRVRIVRI